jgi:hypothetical protein
LLISCIYQQVAELYNYNKSGKTVGQVVLVKMGCLPLVWSIIEQRK